MTKEALKAAIKAMENSNSISYEMMHAIADCKEAQAQPVQEPVALVVSTAPDRIWLDLGFDPQDKDAVSFQELDDVNWSEDNASGYGIEYVRADTAKPLPEQEPVGGEWTPCMKLPIVVHVRKQRSGEAHVSTREGITPVKPDDLIMRGVSGEEYPIGRAIFEQTYSLDTATPQREWVGLTEEQIKGMDAGTTSNSSFYAGALWAEAKLKEKNT